MDIEVGAEGTDLLSLLPIRVFAKIFVFLHFIETEILKLFVILRWKETSYFYFLN